VSAVEIIVSRYDFVNRSRVILRCSRCGTTTWHVAIEDADLYEQASREHVCGKPILTGERVAFRRLLQRLAGGVA
jgi:hypothetical protein